ncbi:hypothetical protein O181_060458 [Austropuccinia psidii MF-1]|uniref:Reverse transcriptase Ty1/copia-type domain-containing protein n=1 Tax=Austropuccinia psidii MF-1 TaxID=1389203 RepID=A0A9Q3EGI6_9BASI|nr:hypothetical protein [Austropuccinia psidii MF-1]
MASAPSPRKGEFMSNILPGGYQSPIVSSGASEYPAQGFDSCERINLYTIFEDDTLRLLRSPVHNGSNCSSNSQEYLMSFQNNPDHFIEAPSDSISTAPKEIDILNLPKGWAMDLVPDKAPKDITSTINTGNIVSGTRRTINVVVPSGGPPSTYHQAMHHPKAALWKVAINEENNAWRPVKLNKAMNLIGSTWVFKEKENEDGIVVWHKARLCVQGFSQVEGLDFNETYTPTGRMNSLRFVLAYCANKNLELHQVDIKMAFHNGVPEEDVYMHYPLGYPHEKKEGTCLKLKRLLYGLKQSRWCWYKCLSDTLKRFAFYPSQEYPCLFFNNKKEDLCFVFVHVDDMIIGGNKACVEDLNKEMKKVFVLDDMGKANFILGIKLERNRGEKKITLSQRLYIDKLLDKYGMSQCHNVLTPMIPNSHLRPAKTLVIGKQ